MSDLEEARREFLDECDFVVRVPCVWFNEGTDWALQCKLLLIPVYLYLGFKRNCAGKLIEIIENDTAFATFQKDISSSQMRRIKDNAPIIHTLERKLSYPYFIKVIDDNWSQLKKKAKIIQFDKLREATRKIRCGKIKIWSEIPSFGIGVTKYIFVAYSALLSCLVNDFSPNEFNAFVENFKKDLMATPDLFVPFKPDVSHLIHQNIIKDIFVTAWLLSYGANGSSYLSVIPGGGGWGDLPFCITEISYRLSLDPRSECYDNLKFSMILKEEQECNYVSYIFDAVSNNHISVKINYTGPQRLTEILIIKIKDKRSLLGPILNSLFSGDLSKFDIEKEPRCITYYPNSPKEFREIDPSEPGAKASYSLPFLTLHGHWNILNKIETSLLEKEEGNTIIYSSCSMGWEMTGLRLLKPEEYRLPDEIRQKKEVLTALSKIKEYEEPEQEEKLDISELGEGIIEILFDSKIAKDAGDTKKSEEADKQLLKETENAESTQNFSLPRYYFEFKAAELIINLESKEGKRALRTVSRETQPYQLLEYFLNKENHKVHWVEAIRIFPKWRKKRTQEITGLEGIFRGVVAKIISEINIERERLISQENIIADRMNIDRQQGFYTLKTPIGSNITESAKLVKEAGQFIGLDNKVVAEKTVSALRLYNKSIGAAMLVLNQKDKISFESSVISDARKILLEQRDILELKVKPITEYYIRKKETFKDKWLEICDRIEFDYIESFIEDIDSEIEAIKQCLKDFPEARDEKFEQIKNLIKRDLTKPENSKELLKKEPILVVVNRVMAEVRKRQKRDTFEISWAWFKALDNKQLKNSADGWLIQAIQSSKEKRNIDFIIARNLKILSYYLYKITIFEAEKEMLRHIKGELTNKEVSDYKKAMKFYKEIMQEYPKIHEGNPSIEELENLLGEKAGAHRPYGQYLLSLLEKGGELHLEDWYKDNMIQDDAEESIIEE